MGGGSLGTFGEEVIHGLNVFAIQYNNATEDSHHATYSSAFNIVMDMMGNVRSISPVFYDVGDK